MILTERALRTSIFLSVFIWIGHAQLSVAVETQQAQQESKSATEHMLALSYYEELDYERALPALTLAQRNSPNDIELNVALLEVLLDSDMTEEAARIADHLDELKRQHETDTALADIALFGQARVQLLTGHRAQAEKKLLELVENSKDAELVTRAADILIEELYADKQFDQAYEVAQTAISRFPRSRYSYRFSQVRPEVTATSGLSVDLAYRIDYDDNVAYPDENFTSGEADYRHVFIADVLYESPFGKNWNFYAQGHFLQSLYHQLDQFNQTRISASTAIGQSGERLGWRFPIEVNQDWLDGDSYRTSLIARPGVYIQFGKNFFSHFYGRIQNDDYHYFPYAQEDRSGEVYGGGVLIAGQASAKFQLHSYLEYNRYDTNGVYWQRDEIVVFAYGEFEFSPKWVAGLALRYQKDNYDNARPVFAERQRDDSKEFYLNVTRKFNGKWRLRGQLSVIDHESNIAIFDYNRNVYSFSVIREF